MFWLTCVRNLLSWVNSFFLLRKQLFAICNKKDFLMYKSSSSLLKLSLWPFVWLNIWSALSPQNNSSAWRNSRNISCSQFSWGSKITYLDGNRCNNVCIKGIFNVWPANNHHTSNTYRIILPSSPLPLTFALHIHSIWDHN